MLVGISGGSASGKSTLALALQQALDGDAKARVLGQDHYYIDQSARFDGDGGAVNFDHPSAIDFELLANHLKALKSNESIEVPIYDFATHSRKAGTKHFDPCDYVIVDGTLLLSQAPCRQWLDLSVFVDAPEDLRFSRRLKRDVTERGRNPEGVRKQYLSQVLPMHTSFVEPSREHANLVVSGEDLNAAVAAVLAELPK